ncbi:histidine--tRNA ligase [candidate division WOR-3 bacterium]|nr:histidine--tRNA ligase [candidate division WOR-3 bacterium]
MSEPDAGPRGRPTRPKGTNDLLPPESGLRHRVETAFRALVESFGFAEVVTPVFEHTEVFVKSAGVVSDIVTKEMYRFTDRSDRDLTLRPEGTPGVVRAILENRFRIPCRLYYVGPFFRYSRPQKGRYREFHQVGIEALGEAAPETDAEVIFIGAEFFRRLGVTDCTVQLNTIGCRTCRPEFRALLVEFLNAKQDRLCDECRTRTDINPLRVFDCKNESCQAVLAHAPKPRERVCSKCAEHFAGVQQGLTRRALAFTLNDRLVRGLDYYDRTTFEYTSAALGAQNSLGGGGRYDYLVAEFGGPDTPAIGFALGLERTTLALREPETLPRRALVFVVWLGATEFSAALKVADDLRAAGIAAQIDYSGRRAKLQFKAADAAGACACVIVGPDELARGVCSVKNLASGEQTEVPSDLLAEHLRPLLQQAAG